MKLNQDFAMAVETVQFLKKKKSNDYIQADKIAEKLDFSVGYLQKIIQALGRHGIVEAKRGRVGGVRLRKRKITLLDLWKVTCGTLDIASQDVALLEKPLRAFSAAMKKVVVA